MSMFFADLVVRTDESRRAFETHPVVLEAVAKGLSLARYRNLLLELYHVVWHFNPVCAAAASRLADTHKQVRYFLYQHMHEESGHEDWVRNDLDAVGVPASDTVSHRASPFTRALVGYNYWAADRAHPAAVLGMLYTLEVISSVYGGPFASAIKESLMLDGERGVSFISAHATLDAEHMAELRLVLNTIDDRAAGDAIVDAALLNFHHFTRIIEQV